MGPAATILAGLTATAEAPVERPTAEIGQIPTRVYPGVTLPPPTPMQFVYPPRTLTPYPPHWCWP